MKIADVNLSLIGKRCKGMFTGMLVDGTITDVKENQYTVEVHFYFDEPHQWGNDSFNKERAWARKIDEFGSLKYLELLEDNNT